MSSEQERDPAFEASQPAAQPKNLATVEEKRQATRFPRETDTEFAAIWLEHGKEHQATVYDESLSGLGLLVDAGLELQIGSRLHIVYGGECLQGEVRHLTPHSDGRTRVGLSCRRLNDQTEI